MQVRSSSQELSGGQRTGHRMLRLTQGKKGEVVNRTSRSQTLCSSPTGIKEIYVYSLPHARAHHLPMTCALSLVPPISGQVTAACDQGHRERERSRGRGAELQLFRFRKQKSGVCNTVEFPRTVSVLGGVYSPYCEQDAFMSRISH